MTPLTENVVRPIIAPAMRARVRSVSELSLRFAYGLHIAFMFMLVAGVSGCSSRGSQESQHATSVDSLSKQAIWIFFGVDTPEDASIDENTVLDAAKEQSVDLKIKPWSKAKAEIEEGKHLPTLLCHKTHPPVFLLDILHFEGRTRFLLVTQELSPLTLESTEFKQSDWNKAIWRSDNENKRIVRIGPNAMTVGHLWHSFGAMKPFERYKTECKLTNSSRNTLRVERISTTCGCTTVGDVTVPKAIPPGETLTIPVSLRSGLDPLTKQSAIVGVTANEGADSKLFRFHIYGWQADCVRSVPSTLDFGLVSRDEPVSLPIRLTAVPDDKYEVSSVDVGELPITCEVKRTPSDKGSYLLHFALNPSGLSVGKHARKIQVKNSSRRRPVVDIAVRCEVASEIEVKPGIAEFSDIKKRETSEKVEIAFEHKNKQPFSLSIIEGSDHLSVEIQEADSKSFALISIKKEPEKTMTGELRFLATAKSSKEEITVPFYIFP